MFQPTHKFYIKALYKNILAEGSLFFDDRARIYIRNTARKSFKDYKTCQDVDRPYLHGHQPSDHRLHDPEPFVPHVPHTAPPPALCPPLCSLITQHLGKKLEPELPIPQYKPLHPGRKANLLWKHRSMLLDRVSVPLPFEIICELEHKAGAPMTHPLACSNLLTGGPRWDDFYSSFTKTVKMIQHLQPDISKLAHPISKITRKETLPKSPYENQHPGSLLEFLGSSADDSKDPFRFTNRQLHRVYKKLLQQIPLINVVYSDQLWNPQDYKITKSQWVPQGVTKLLEDVPNAIDLKRQEEEAWKSIVENASNMMINTNSNDNEYSLQPHEVERRSKKYKSILRKSKAVSTYDSCNMLSSTVESTPFELLTEAKPYGGIPLHDLLWLHTSINDISAAKKRLSVSLQSELSGSILISMKRITPSANKKTNPTRRSFAA
ncbi:hypothetical protein [Parasitella parasitica]|uniref:LYR motif-containing protein Cup1-like N-terminal domain-containing protein n=1 Tax=Parasitella parasitica TaxID=35722 RepID=A0A0B7NGK1_9FUNG|nr:hypothetical protein [Parasitella parasitica]